MTTDLANTCETVDMDLPWFVNGSLDDARAAEIRHHLENCASCLGEADRLASLRQALHPVDPAPRDDVLSESDAWDALQQRVANDNRHGDRRWMLQAAAMFMGAALVVGVLLGPQLLEPRFRMATSASPTAVASVILQVTFAPDAELADLRNVLERFDAVVMTESAMGESILLEIPLADRQEPQRLASELRQMPQVQAVEIREAAGDD